MKIRLPVAPALLAALTVAEHAFCEIAQLRTWKTELGVSQVRVSPNGRWVITRGASGIEVFELATGVRIGRWSLALGMRDFTEPLGFDVSPDGQLAAIAANETLAVLRIPEARLKVARRREGSGGVVAFSRDGERLVVGRYEIWDADSLTLMGRLPQPRSPWVTALSPDGRTLAAAGERTIEVWDVTRWALRDTFSGHKWSTSLSYSADGRWLAAGGAQGVTVWDVTRRKVAWRRAFPVCCAGQFIALSPDGLWLITGRENGITLISTRTGEPIRNWTTDDRGVRSATFTPDGRRLVTASFQGDVRVWSFNTLLGSPGARWQ